MRRAGLDLAQHFVPLLAQGGHRALGGMAEWLTPPCPTPSSIRNMGTSSREPDVLQGKYSVSTHKLGAKDYIYKDF